MKHRDLAPVARVNQLLRDKGYGFLVTPEGREIYFHKDSVLNRGFGRLKVGSTVVFSEEQGDRGPQASSVRLTARHGLRQIARRPAA